MSQKWRIIGISDNGSNARSNIDREIITPHARKCRTCPNPLVRTSDEAGYSHHHPFSPTENLSHLCHSLPTARYSYEQLLCGFGGMASHDMVSVKRKPQTGQKRDRAHQDLSRERRHSLSMNDRGLRECERRFPLPLISVES